MTDPFAHKLMVTPASPASPASWIPFPFESTHTRSPMPPVPDVGGGGVEAGTKPASIVLFTCPDASVIADVYPELTAASLSSAASVPWFAFVSDAPDGTTNWT